MKTRNALYLAAWLLSSGLAFGTTVSSYYFDAAITVPWNTSGTYWSTLAAGGGTLSPWPAPWDPAQSTTNTTIYDACFCATGLGRTGTYPGPTNSTLQELGGIVFSTGNCTLRGTG